MQCQWLIFDVDFCYMNYIEFLVTLYCMKLHIYLSWYMYVCSLSRYCLFELNVDPILFWINVFYCCIKYFHINVPSMNSIEIYLKTESKVWQITISNIFSSKNWQLNTRLNRLLIILSPTGPVFNLSIWSVCRWWINNLVSLMPDYWIFIKNDSLFIMHAITDFFFYSYWACIEKNLPYKFDSLSASFLLKH